MFFYVYLAPEVISVAHENGALGMQALIAILRGFLQNCFITTFQDNRTIDAIVEEIERLPEDYDRKIVKEIWRVLEKRNRFIYCLVPDYVGGKSDEECAKEQVDEAMLDLLLLTENDDEVENVEVATLLNYQHTDFEASRDRLVSNGLTLLADSTSGRQFLDDYLKKGLKYARTIVISDKYFGENYQGNYQYNAIEFFRWLETVIDDPNTCTITFQCGEPGEAARDLQVMSNELRACKKGRLVGLRVRLHLYGTDAPNFLPHQRYLLTDQFALSIDPGMDFINPRDGQIRAISFSYKRMEDVERILDSYRGGEIREMEL